MAAMVDEVAELTVRDLGENGPPVPPNRRAPGGPVRSPCSVCWSVHLIRRTQQPDAEAVPG